MKHYTYYPGCSAHATAAGLAPSVATVAGLLDIELIELDDWNCCGSTPYGSLEHEESLVVAARNLALAEKRGLDLVTPCSSCFLTLYKTNLFLKDHPKTMTHVQQALAAANLQYHGDTRVRLLLEVLVNDITPEFITARIKHPLKGLKVAPYYGCQEARPDHGYDNAESPQALDKLVVALGAEAVPYPLKNHCCGGALIISEEDLGLELMRKLFVNAVENGAQCITTTCPLCQTNLDAYQSRVNKKFKTNFNLPVLFLTQLMGIALGIGNRELGLSTNIVPANRVLAGYL